MEYILIWILTIIITFIMNVSTVGKILKILMDSGYKINWDKFENFSKFLDPRLEQMQKIIRFIPFLNITYSFYLDIKLKNNDIIMSDAFRVLDIVEDMSDEEIEQYSKDPSVLTAFNLSIESLKERKLDKNINSTLEDNISLDNDEQEFYTNQLTTDQQKQELERLKQSLIIKDNKEKNKVNIKRR